MCGIFALISKCADRNVRLEPDEIKNALNRRGPDNFTFQQIVADDSVVSLFHSRLAIVDLDQRSNQPFHYKDVTLIFNGEIYNHEALKKDLVANGYNFRTSSDTEIFAAGWHYWGAEIMPRLDGMYAAIVFDHRDDNVYVLRDHLGIKPLYQYATMHSICFSSNIAAVRAVSNSSLRLNDSTVHKFILTGVHDEGEDTFFKDIKAIKPGRVYRYNKRMNSLDCIGDYTSKLFDLSKRGHGRSHEVQFEELIKAVVTDYAKTDVTNCLTLSGGLDSSLLSAIINSSGQSIDPIHFKSNDQLADESEWMYRVCEQLNLSPIVVHQNSIFSLDLLKDVLRAQEEPFSSLSCISQFLVYSEISKKNYKVSLDGQGADELMAGYEGYPEFYFASLINQLHLSQAMTFLFYRSDRLRILKRYIYRVIDQLLSGGITRKKHSQLVSTFSKTFGAELPNKENLLSHTFDGNVFAKDIFIHRLRFALTSFELGRLLRLLDKNSMHHSIESRTPFLSQRLINSVFSLSFNKFLGDKGETKQIIRDLLAHFGLGFLSKRHTKLGFAYSSKRSGTQITKRLYQDIIRSSERRKLESKFKIRLPEKYSSVPASMRERLVILLVWGLVIDEG